MNKLFLFFFFSFLSVALKAQDSSAQQRFQSVQNNLGLSWHASVKGQADLWTGAGKKNFETALGKAAYYFPIFDSILKKEGVPTDLKFLAVAYTGLQFDYFDTLDGARGIWHFNYTNAKLFDLQITSYVDERLDTRRSTQAFARAMKQYFGIYNDWKLAMAAFLSSAPQVNKAIRYQGGENDFWKIKEHLGPAAGAVVTRVSAAFLLYNHSAAYKLAPKKFDAPVGGASVYIGHWYSLEILAQKSKIPLNTLSFLNPTYKRYVLPDMPDSFLLVLPAQLKDSLRWVKQLTYTPYDVDYFEGKEVPAQEPRKDTLQHEVKEGETLTSIAVIYGVKTEEIQEWNELEDEEIRIGQFLQIIKEKKPEAKPAPKPAPKPAYRVHTVRSGDTLSGIASKYRCTVPEIKKWNNLKSNTIRPGQKLKIRK